jgi:CDP-glucose 4,6-dehydratase
VFEIYKDKKIFVTGGTGFKGSWLVKWLLNLGAKVKNYSLPLYYLGNTKHFKLLNLCGVNNTFYDFADILNYNWLRNSIIEFKPDLIFHIAAQPIVLESFAHPKDTYETNMMGTINLIESCMNVDSLNGICLVTTDKVYSNCNDIYAKREIDELGANDPYSTSKACIELIAESYRNYFRNYLKQQDFIISTVRAGNVIGGGDFGKHRIIPDYIKAIQDKKEFLLRNPYATRPYSFVLDILSGYLKVGEQILNGDCTVNNSFNFSSKDDGVSNDILINLLQKYYFYDNIKRNYNSQDILEKTYLTLDSTKARKVLNWKSKYNVEQAVRQTMNWYKEYIENNNIITNRQIEEYCGV